MGVFNLSLSLCLYVSSSVSLCLRIPAFAFVSTVINHPKPPPQMLWDTFGCVNPPTPRHARGGTHTCAQMLLRGTHVATSDHMPHTDASQRTFSHLCFWSVVPTMFSTCTAAAVPSCCHTAHTHTVSYQVRIFLAQMLYYSPVYFNFSSNTNDVSHILKKKSPLRCPKCVLSCSVFPIGSNLMYNDMGI